jgi:5-methylcytosine-specific restriction endonuclease McrA
MNWCRPEKRLSIYLRDGLSCCYCGASVEGGAKLTLDHLIPHSKGGSNDQSNIITACFTCNSSRGSRSWSKFAAKVAAYLNIDKAVIVRHIRNCRSRKLDVAAAKNLIALRGGFTAALKGSK